ncbi:MAG: DUF3307 domain-containing protein [Candidatus Promineifilaceae bacterium]
MLLIQMIVAHLFGDYILQWDKLAAWKARELRGVLAHGLIVAGVTLLFSYPYDMDWLPWALAIGISHIMVDASGYYATHNQWLKKRVSPFTLYIGDQVIHFVLILLFLQLSGNLPTFATIGDLLHENKWWAIVLAYTFIAMPSWVLIEFFVSGFVRQTAPDFKRAKRDKYTMILERWVIATLVVIGQVPLIFIATIPTVTRRWQDWRSEQANSYVAEFLVSLMLAVLAGVFLNQIFM